MRLYVCKCLYKMKHIRDRMESCDVSSMEIVSFSVVVKVDLVLFVFCKLYFVPVAAEMHSICVHVTCFIFVRV